MSEEYEEAPKMADLQKEIGRRVKRQRERYKDGAGYAPSQERLAELLATLGIDVSQGQIGHIESGVRLPSVPLLNALAVFFDVSVDYLLGRTENESSIAMLEEELRTGGISGRLSSLYKQLPPERQQELYQFAEALHTITQREQNGDALTLSDPIMLRGSINAAINKYGEQKVRTFLEVMTDINPRWRLFLDRHFPPEQKSIKRS